MLLVLESQILIKFVPPFTRNTMQCMRLSSDQMNSMVWTNHFSKILFAEMQIITTRIELTTSRVILACKVNVLNLIGPSTFNALHFLNVIVYELDERCTLKTLILVWIKLVTEFWDHLATRNDDPSSNNRALSMTHNKWVMDTESLIPREISITH